jgi:hypothetical protein
MPYKNPERKKEWERLHRPERLARRRELRQGQASEQTSRPRVTRESEGGIGFLVPLVAGGTLAAYNPKLGMGAGGLTIAVAADALRMLQHAQPGLHFPRLDLLVNWILHPEPPAVGCENTHLSGISISSYKSNPTCIEN